MSHRTFDIVKTSFVSALRFVVTKKANSTFMASSTAFISVHSCAGVAQAPPLLGDSRLQHADEGENGGMKGSHRAPVQICVFEIHRPLICTRTVHKEQMKQWS